MYPEINCLLPFRVGVVDTGSRRFVGFSYPKRDTDDITLTTVNESSCVPSRSTDIEDKILQKVLGSRIMTCWLRVVVLLITSYKTRVKRQIHKSFLILSREVKTRQISPLLDGCRYVTRTDKSSVGPTSNKIKFYKEKTKVVCLVVLL